MHWASCRPPATTPSKLERDDLEHASDGKRDLDSTQPGLFLINIHVTHERHRGQFREVFGAVCRNRFSFGHACATGIARGD